MLMRTRSVVRRGLASGVVPLALLAALPLVQWCSICSDPLSLECLFRGPVEGAGAMPACAAEPAPCAAEQTAGATERSACPAEGAACAAERHACPGRAASGGACPDEHRGRGTFCVGAPLGGVGVRPLAPALTAPAGQPAPVADAPSAQPPRETGAADPRVEAR